MHFEKASGPDPKSRRGSAPAADVVDAVACDEIDAAVPVRGWDAPPPHAATIAPHANVAVASSQARLRWL
jgi:hypothetical protein